MLAVFNKCSTQGRELQVGMQARFSFSGHPVGFGKERWGTWLSETHPLASRQVGHLVPCASAWTPRCAPPKALARRCTYKGLACTSVLA